MYFVQMEKKSQIFRIFSKLILISKDALVIAFTTEKQPHTKVQNKATINNTGDRFLRR